MTQAQRGGAVDSAPHAAGNNGVSPPPPRRSLRVWGRRIWCAAMLWGVLLFGAGAEAAPAYEVTQPNRAGLVVVHSDGSIVSRCVDFAPSAISGYELLQSSGLDLGVEASSMGASICRLDGQGCSPPGQSCFCQCMSSPCLYWSYWHLNGGQWTYSNLGATFSMVQPGDVDAWVWGEGTIGRDAHNAPPNLTFDQVCAPPTTPTETPTATAVATDTPIPTPPPAVALGSPVWTPTPGSELGADGGQAERSAEAPHASQPSAPDRDSARDSVRVRLLALLTGSLLILGAPLLFAFAWVLVWSFWRKG